MRIFKDMELAEQLDSGVPGILLSYETLYVGEFSCREERKYG